jgi:plasmid stabilization system protein ParE
VAEVVYSRHAFADLERLADFLIKDAPQAAVKAIEVIRDGIEILERHPFVGRPCEEGLWELLISYGKSDYVALDVMSKAKKLYWRSPFVTNGRPGYST